MTLKLYLNKSYTHKEGSARHLILVGLGLVVQSDLRRKVSSVGQGTLRGLLVTCGFGLLQA